MAKAKRPKPSIPPELRKEVAALVRAIARRYHAGAAAWPRKEETTRAILLYSRFCSAAAVNGVLTRAASTTVL